MRAFLHTCLPLFLILAQLTPTGAGASSQPSESDCQVMRRHLIQNQKTLQELQRFLEAETRNPGAPNRIQSGVQAARNTFGVLTAASATAAAYFWFKSKNRRSMSTQDFEEVRRLSRALTGNVLFMGSVTAVLHEYKYDAHQMQKEIAELEEKLNQESSEVNDYCPKSEP